MSKRNLERIVSFYPAFDKRDSNPKKNYGIHGVDLFMRLRGTEGTVQFRLFTNWQLPHVTKETDGRTLLLASLGPQGSGTKQLAGSGLAEAAKHLSQAERFLGRGHGLDQVHLDCFYHPLPSDLGYHSPRPMYEGQTPMDGECEWVPGGVCYYDGSTLNAERIFEVLLREGSDGVWRELEGYYEDTFSVEVHDAVQP